MAKKKMRKFAEGGFSAAQEEWLGGADRTDPYILARMRSAVPDQAGPSESTIEDESGRGNISPNAAAFNKGTGNEPSTATNKVTKVVANKAQSDWDNNKKMLPGHKNIDSDWDNIYKMLPGHNKSNVRLKLKSGGAVKKMASGGSASKRADGCAVKGKTRGKFV